MSGTAGSAAWDQAGYRALDTARPSFRTSPWVRGAPHKRVAAIIVLKSGAILAFTGGRPPVGGSEQRVQYSRRRRRRHPRTVSGVTTRRVCSMLSTLWPATSRTDDLSYGASSRRRPVVDGELLSEGRGCQGRAGETDAFSAAVSAVESGERVRRVRRPRGGVPSAGGRPPKGEATRRCCLLVQVQYSDRTGLEHEPGG